MQHFVTIFLFFFLLTTPAWTQPSWQWGKRGGSTNAATNGCCYENATDMTTDRNGNVYVLGNGNMGINVDGHTHPGYGNNLSSGNLLIASWDCTGSFRWMKVIGSYSTSGAKSIRADTLGGIYVTGYTISNNSLGYTYFDGDSALGNTNKSMFIVKYDTAGNYRWLHMPQSDTVGPASITYTGSIDMDVAPNGDVFVFCYLSPGVYSGAYIVNAQGFHVLRYDAAGTFQSGTPMDVHVGGGWGGGGELYNVQQGGFKRDHQNGRYYLAGHFDANFGTMGIGTTAILNPSYIGCFAGNGVALWARQSFSSNPSAQMSGRIWGRPVTDAQCNIYITGNTFHGQEWNGHTFTNALTTLEWACPFVVKMDTNGTTIWATNASVIGAANGSAISIHGNELAVTGNFYQKMEWDGIALEQGVNEYADVFLARLNAQTGAVLAIDTLLSSYGTEEIPGVTVSDERGNYYVGGKFYNDLVVAGDTLQNYGGETDWFVAKFGKADCSCILPSAAFTSAAGTGTDVNFTYTGSGQPDSIVWNFGDGETGSGATVAHAYLQAGAYNVCVTAYNSCGSHVYCNVANTAPVGVEAAAFGNVHVYPNPVTNLIAVSGLTGTTHFTLYNSFGGIVGDGMLIGTLDTVDVRLLAPGWYLLALENASGKLYVKLIKM